MLTADAVYGFTQTILLSRFDDPKPTPDIHREWWELVCRPDRQIAIAAPRGHAKTTAITHSFVLAEMLFRDRDFALIVSDTEGQAIQFLGDIKKELQENEDLIALFKIGRFVKDAETDIIVEFEDGKQFRIIAKGSEQKVRGLKWRNKRPNLIIGDDLENDEIVLNEERRDKFRRWFFNALLPCGSDDCIFRIVGTILHMDSLLERLMPAWGSENTIIDGLRQYQKPRAEGYPWVAVRYQAHNEDFSLLLWKEKFSKERYIKIRQGYLEQGFPEGYSQEYLNYPIDETTAYFRKDDFIPIKDKNEHIDYYVGGDLAISEKDSRAFTVFVIVGVNRFGRLKVVDVRRFRGDSLDIMNELFSIYAKYNPQEFFLEKENIARSIGPVLYQEMNRRNQFLSITEIIPSQDKVKRARSIQARMRAGGIEVDMNASWYNDFYIELTQFPKSVYKDQVDAFAMIGLGLDSVLDAQSYEELQDEAWEDFEDSFGFMHPRQSHDEDELFADADELTGY